MKNKPLVRCWDCEYCHCMSPYGPKEREAVDSLMYECKKAPQEVVTFDPVKGKCRTGVIVFCVKKNADGHCKDFKLDTRVEEPLIHPSEFTESKFFGPEKLIKLFRRKKK